MGFQKEGITHNCSGTRVANEVATTAGSQIGLKEALIHTDPIVVEIHLSPFPRRNIGNPAEGDDVVAAGDGSEDARLDVHRAVGSSRPI